VRTKTSEDKQQQRPQQQQQQQHAALSTPTVTNRSSKQQPIAILLARRGDLTQEVSIVSYTVALHDSTGLQETSQSENLSTIGIDKSAVNGSTTVLIFPFPLQLHHCI
jgi:hypothetical protein